MKNIYLTESQLKQFCTYILKEEEYNVVHSLGVFNTPQEAQEKAEFLRQNNIDSVSKGTEVLIYVEKNIMDTDYVDDVIEYAKQLIQQCGYKQIDESNVVKENIITKIEYIK